MDRAMLHKNMEIRSKWENVTNEGQESKLGDGTGCTDSGRVGKEVSQVFYTLLLETNQTKTMQTKYLAILT